MAGLFTLRKDVCLQGRGSSYKGEKAHLSAQSVDMTVIREQLNFDLSGGQIAAFIVPILHPVDI